MEKKIKKVKLFTHIDLDGIGPKILSDLAFDEVDVSYCNYNNINTKVTNFLICGKEKEFDMIYITDISVDKSTADLIETTAKDKVLLFDHHITAVWLNEYSWAFVKDIEYAVKGDQVIEQKSCGTSLFHTYLLKEKLLVKQDGTVYNVSDFVERVRRYDTWDWFAMGDTTAKQLSMLMDILGRDRFAKKFLEYVKTYDHVKFDATDTLLLEIEQEKIDKYIDARKRNIIEKEICGHKAAFVFAESYKSETGNRIAEETEYDIVIIVDPGLSVSLRCGQGCDVNVHEIAAVYGGGGHPKAAGFPLGMDLKMEILNAIFDVKEKTE